MHWCGGEDQKYCMKAKKRLPKNRAAGLEQLFGSRTRVKLLKLFLNSPEKMFFVREIARAINSQINSVRRELLNLKDLGIIKEVEAWFYIERGWEKKRDLLQLIQLNYPSLAIVC